MSEGGCLRLLFGPGFERGLDLLSGKGWPSTRSKDEKSLEVT
jgi:hypothetical protein